MAIAPYKKKNHVLVCALARQLVRSSIKLWQAVRRVSTACGTLGLGYLYTAIGATHGLERSFRSVFPHLRLCGEEDESFQRRHVCLTSGRAQDR